MSNPAVHVPIEDRPLLDVHSGGRMGPGRRDGLTALQIEVIRRTVRRTPEVMVKVTGGARKLGAVAAHLSYISDKGKLAIETDEGERVSKEGRKGSSRTGIWSSRLGSTASRPKADPG